MDEHCCDRWIVSRIFISGKDNDCPINVANSRSPVQNLCLQDWQSFYNNTTSIHRGLYKPVTYISISDEVLKVKQKTHHNTKSYTEIKKKQYIIIDFNEGTHMITIFMIACHHTETPNIDENKIHSTNPSEPSVVIEEDPSVEHQDTGIRNTDNLKCYDGVIQIALMETRMEFEAYLHDIHINVVDFEDVNTTSAEPVSIESDRYLITHGVYITGTDGQYVDDEFLWTSDYNSTSGTNMYAPGPIEIDAGGFTTTIRFQEENCVYGIGMMFIDADFPELGPSGIEIFNSNEEQLQETMGF